MAERYFVATKNGKSPTIPVIREAEAIRDLNYMKKGWPNKDWQVSKVGYRSNEKTIFLSGITNAEVRESLKGELISRYSHMFKINDHIQMDLFKRKRV